MATPHLPRFERLERALRAFELWRAARDPEPREAFLARHADLRELLEPLFDEPGPTLQPAEAADLAPGSLGTRVPGYRVERELGRGGMGVVFAATRLTDGRRAAVKVLNAARLSSPTAIERFEREAAILQRLDHPGIVRHLDFLRAEGQLCLAMERVEGASLDRVIARLRAVPVAALSSDDLMRAIAAECEGTPPATEATHPYVEQVALLTATIADALDAAHRHGIVHRDVKPANVIVRVDGSPVLTDFGIARADDLPDLTLTGDFAGTPYYVSPELAMARRAPVDHRTDLFSLGVTLYELLTLNRPFEARTTQEVLGRIVAKEPTDPARVQPAVPPELSAITFRALEKDPDNRYPTAAAFAADLRSFVARGTVLARRVPWPVRAWRFGRRHPARIAAGAGVSAVLAAAAVLALEAPRIAAARAAERTAQLEALLESAFVELSEGDAAAAVPFAEAALALVPDDGEALHALCAAQVLMGQDRRAEAALDAAADAGETPDQRRLRAWMHAYRGRPEVAAELLTGLTEPSGPVSSFLASNLELLFGEAGEPDRFRSAFDLQLRAVLQDPAPRRLHLAQLAHLAGHVGDRVVAPQVAAALVELWPESAHAWFWSGYAVAGFDRGRAIAAYRRAVELQPDFGLALLNLGAHLEANGGSDAEAEAITRRALALRPRDATVRYNLGVVLRKTGRIDEAKAAFEDALRLRPRHAESHNNLGTIFASGGDMERAREHLELALAAREAYAEAHLNFANVLHALGRGPESIAHVQRAVELRPGYTKAHLLAAMLLNYHEQHAAAVPHWRQGIAAMPAAADVHRCCVECLVQAGAFADVAAETIRWARQDPAQRDRWTELQAVLVDPRTPPEARDLAAVAALVARAAPAAGDDEMALEQLARLLGAAGDETAIRAALAGFAGDPAVDRVLARLPSVASR